MEKNLKIVILTFFILKEEKTGKTKIKTTVNIRFSIKTSDITLPENIRSDVKKSEVATLI